MNYNDINNIGLIATTVISIIGSMYLLYLVSHADTSPASKKANEAIDHYARTGKTKAEEIEEKELEERRNWKRKYWTGFGEYNPDRKKEKCK